MIRKAIGVLFILILCGVLAACCPAPEPEGPTGPRQSTVPPSDLELFFEGYDGCFVLWDVAAEEYTRYNPSRCARRLSPCSTYKIPHALIGLETGVILDQHHVREWNGTRHPVEIWNQNHTMASAVQNSVVWYFQAVATEIGEERMQAYLDAFGYGNQDISGGLTQFWLGSSLAISADEQIDFIYHLDKGDLPVSERSMEIVKEVIVLEETDVFVYRGKTGSCTPEGGHSLGWFVGYVERDDTTYVFATNIQGAEAEGQKARQIGKVILEHLGVFP